MSFLRRFRTPEEEELPPPVVRKPRKEESKEEPRAPSPSPGPIRTQEGESVLGPGFHWEGTLRGKGRIRLEGHFEGLIRVQGEVIVGPQGRVVVEEVEALTLVVAGLLQGPVKAQRVVLKQTGRLHGDVVTTSLEAEAGGFLKGRVQMEEKLTFTWDESEEASPIAPPQKTEDTEQGREEASSSEPG